MIVKNIFRLGICILISALVFIAFPAWSATYYVRPGGSDSYAGTTNTDAGAWRTIGKCASTITAGDTCNVQAGTYTDQISTLAHGGTSDSNRVTYLASGTVQLKGIIINKDYVTFNGFTVTGCSSCTANVQTSGNYANILNCTVYNNPNSSSGNEITLGGTHNLIQNSHIYSSINRGDDYPMIGIGGSYNTVDNNEIGPGVDTDSIRAWGHDHVISNNYFHDFTLSSGSQAHMDLFQTFADNCPSCTAYNIHFRNNFAINSAHQLFNISQDGASGMHDIYIYNNVFVHFGGQGNLGVPNMIIANNTFIDVDSSNAFALWFPDQGAFLSTNTKVENNIFIATWSGNAYAGAPLPSGFVGDYNYIAVRSGSTYNADNGYNETHGQKGGNPYLASYTGSDACGTFSFSTHSCSNFDLKPTINSTKLIGKGTTLSSYFTTDRDGNTRPAGAWTIGAYEYGTGGGIDPSLTVTESGTGTGTVTSSPAGINCGSTCSANYDGGTVVTLTASPSGGSTFAGWGGACAGTGVCAVTMDAAKAVTATFTAPPPPSNYNLAIIKSGAGTGTVTSSPSGINCGSTCSAAYTDGTTVTLTATPASGGSFTGWSGSGCSGTGTCVVTMNAATTITATFAPPPPPVNYSLVISKSGTGTGTISSLPSGINCGSTCSAAYTGGTVVTLTASPDTSNSFAGWSGGGCAGMGSCAVTMNAAKTVTATFTAPPPQSNYTLTSLKSGAGTGYVTSSPSGISCGTTCSSDYTSGTTVTLTSTPDTGKTFIGWSGSGCSGTGSCSVTMNAAHTVTANFGTPPAAHHWRLFILKSHIVRVVAGNGTVASSPTGIDCGTTCEADYTDGTEITLTATPDPGNSFTGWSGGGCSGTGACVVSANNDTSVTATFASNSSSASGESGGGGCFIATAAYGSYLDPHVYVLRDFRDRYLLTNSLGQAFVDSYYRYSPPVADFISKHETLKIAVRLALTPVVGGVEHPYTAASTLLIIPIGIILALRRREKRSQ